MVSVSATGASVTGTVVPSVVSVVGFVDCPTSPPADCARLTRRQPSSIDWSMTISGAL